MISCLKLAPEPFQEVCDGLKTFDLRHEDEAPFDEGDIVRFREWTEWGWDGMGLGRPGHSRAIYRPRSLCRDHVNTPRRRPCSPARGGMLRLPNALGHLLGLPVRVKKAVASC